ncbi:benzoate 4-monooxygenase cytochrome P450 [Podospora appendiculata]|uniref:Benzoate 4-monooxygenase cytochrome P450 n=1 Tax=Podospora appendiculata TaxID=314037 RepID=A0AAE0XD33_9PEZI|nr:benzoate 4-monooxygenase cytochrome P450 [Podospora appendiculata]
MALISGAALFGIATSLVVYFVATRIAVWKRMRHIPGPPGAGWSMWWIARHQISGKMCKHTLTVGEKYATRPRLRRIWSVHSGYQRSPWYMGFRVDPRKDYVLTAMDNKEHHRIRAHLLLGYSGKGLDNQEAIIDDQLTKFIALIERKYLSDRSGLRPMQMGLAFQLLSNDMTAAVEFGKPFGYVEADSDYLGIIATLESMFLSIQMLAMFPPLLALLSSRLARPFLPQPHDGSSIGQFFGLVQDRVDERYGDGKVRNLDVIQRFVDSGLTRSEVESEAIVHLLGGSDTTAMAIRTAVFYLSCTPHACRALQAEIDAAVAAVNSDVSRPVIADAQAARLPYLQACIKEALRVWPPVLGLMAKCSDKDDVIAGQLVPAGTHVAWNPFGIMHNKAVFGDDAAVFDPQRWLDAEPAKLREMEGVQGLVFAAGTRWECLGKRLAYMELGKILFELFYRYDFSMVNPVEPFHRINQGLMIQEHMDVRITRRE